MACVAVKYSVCAGRISTCGPRRLPFCTRPVCLPVLARLVLPGKTTIPARAREKKKAAPVPLTKLSAAAGLVTPLAAAFPAAPSTSWPTRPATARR
jgi:hypothetical protein